jgi:3-carboxymuconate cyclase
MNASHALPDLLIGSYTGDSNGSGEGVSRVSSLPDGTLGEPRLAVEADSPSFLAVHSRLPVVYAVGEVAQTLSAFRLADTGILADAGILEPIGGAWPAGAAVCHVAVDPHGRFAVAACWGDGRVIAYDLDDQTGAITARREAAPAADPHAGARVPDRTSRAHASLFLPDGRVMTTDLGFDLARVWRWTPDAGLELDHEVTLPVGSGPRHLAQHPAGHVYIVTEYSIDVLVLTPDASGRFSLAAAVPVLAGGAHDGDAAAHISLDEGARHVHVTVRGANRIAVLGVRDGGARLEPIADVACGGDRPRHHLQREGVIHVANQRSSEVATFLIDPVTGIPEQLLQTVPTGTPTCLVALQG